MTAASETKMNSEFLGTDNGSLDVRLVNRFEYEGAKNVCSSGKSTFVFLRRELMKSSVERLEKLVLWC